MTKLHPFVARLANEIRPPMDCTTHQLKAIDTAIALMAAWCDMFQDVMTRLCAPPPTVTIPLKEYERLKAGYGRGAYERGQLSAQWQGAMGQGIFAPDGSAGVFWKKP